MNFFNFFTVIRMHLEQTTDTFFFAGGSIQNITSGSKFSRIDPEKSEFSDKRIGGDFENQGGERFVIAWFAFFFLIVVGIDSFGCRNIQGGRKESIDSIQNELDTFVGERASAIHWIKFIL